MTTIFIGPIGGGATPQNGASIKNYHIINVLRPLLGRELVTIDTEHWRRSPKVLWRLFTTLLRHRKAHYIVSTSYGSANLFIRLVQRVCPKAAVTYWVIGGYVDKMIADGTLKAAPYRRLSRMIVEGASMQRNLLACGIENAVVMPNFKPIVSVPMQPKAAGGPLKFVFLSRIIPQKGVELIVDSVAQLKSRGGVKEADFSVSFYGPIDADYEPQFRQRIAEHTNIEYCGFLDLRKEENYRTLAQHDVMLFPTYWRTEGCPGVVIDAFMCGLAVIASNWNLNADYIADGRTGLIVEPRNSNALADAMLQCIQNPDMVHTMQTNARSEANRYAISTVLSPQNLHALSLI
jgi:glycosyltransferase involved in cell wall biosynthesis